MSFDLEKVFAHLDGKAMPFDKVKEEIRNVMLENLANLSPEIQWEDVYYLMVDMGWITFPHDESSGLSSTVEFRICEDKREVKKRMDTYKKHFIHAAAKRFPRDLRNGHTDIPARFNTHEYKKAVRELLLEDKISTYRTSSSRGPNVPTTEAIQSFSYGS